MLKDHYLTTDHEMVMEHIGKLNKTCLNVQESAANGNFLHNEQYLQDIHQSMQILQALNVKKTERDRVNGVRA